MPNSKNTDSDTLNNKDYVTRTDVDEMLKKFSTSKPATNAPASNSKEFVSVIFLLYFYTHIT